MEAQLARGLMASMRHKGGVLTLRLSPDHLGAVKVELVVEDGKVSATFDAQNEQTRQLLHANLDSLRRAVQERGLVVDRVQVVGGAQAAPKPSEANGGRESGTGQNPHEQPNSGGNRRGQHENLQGGSRSDLVPEHGAGDIWTEELDPAHGLLRLRLDAVV